MLRPRLQPFGYPSRGAGRNHLLTPTAPVARVSMVVYLLPFGQRQPCQGGVRRQPCQGDVGTVLEGDCALWDWVTLAESRVARPTAATVHERAGGLELDVRFTLSHEEFSFALVRNSNNQK